MKLLSSVMNFKFILLLLAGYEISWTFACNGYKAKLISLETCGGPDEIVTVEPGFNVQLNKKCELIPTGCIAHKAFKTAQANYRITKDGITLVEKDVDLCAVAAAENVEGKNLLKMFALPEQCPVEEGRVCATADTKADLSRLKPLLSMAKGDIFVNSTVIHDTGKSCLHMHLEITK